MTLILKMRRKACRRVLLHTLHSMDLFGSFDCLLIHFSLAGPGEEDLEKIENQESKENANRKGRQLGLPELDPDALPSSMVQKYLILDSKR